jgi:hypothetical protein
MTWASAHRPLFALVAALAAVATFAAGAAAAAEKQRIEVAGTLVCLGCHLEKEYGAEAQCTLHAKHAQGFLAEDGTLYTLLDNGRGHLLITEKKLAGAPLRLEAYAFPKTQILEVIRFKKKEGGEWVQHDYCRNCGFEKGDHPGRDLCEECAE